MVNLVRAVSFVNETAPRLYGKSLTDFRFSEIFLRCGTVPDPPAGFLRKKSRERPGEKGHIIPASTSGGASSYFRGSIE